MGIGAGQLVLVDGHDLSEDVTSFDHEFSKTLKPRTAIGHEWRRRVSQGLKDRSWSMSAFWEADRAALVFREDGVQQLMVRVYGNAPGAYAHGFRGAISPKSATETPVEDLVMWSSEGNVNAAGVQEGRCLYAAADALANGDNDFYDTDPVDIGVDADPRTVRLTCSLRADAPESDVDLFHAAAVAGPWTLVDASLQLADLQNSSAPVGIVGVAYTGVLRRHLGIRVTAAAVGTFNAVVIAELE